MLMNGLEAVLRSIKSRRWIAVNVTIENASVAVKERLIAMATSASRERYYRPSVRYRSRIAGKEYQGTRIAFGDFETTNLAYARKLLSRLQAKHAMAYLNPSDPTDAVLVRRPRFAALFLCGCGLAAIAVAIGIGLLATIKW